MPAQTEDERYIQELQEYLKEHFAGRDEEVKKRRLARDGDDFTAEDVPKAYRATAQLVNIKRNADVLQRMQAIVTDDDPSWEVPPIDEERSAKDNASLRERWVAASIERMTEESGRDAIRMAVDAALGDSIGILKLTYLPDSWNDEPKRSYEVEEEQEQDGQKVKVKVKKEKEAKDYLSEVKEYRKTARFPFWLEDVDVLNYYPLHDGRKIVEVLEISERQILPAMKAFNIKAVGTGSERKFAKLRKGEKFPVNGGLDSSTREKVTCIERWTENDVTYYLDGKKVDYVETNYGFIPFVEIPGYQTSSRDPKKATRSVIDGQRELVKEMRRILTIWMNWAYMAGWPFLEAPEDDGNGTGIPDSATNVTQLEAGAILKHGTKFVEPPSAGRDLSALAQIFQAEADRSGLSSVMYGNASGISSGYMGSDLRAAAMSVLKPIIRNVGRGVSTVGRMMQMLIDRRVGEVVYVYGFNATPRPRKGTLAAERQRNSGTKAGREWLGLGPKDIKGYYSIKATIRPLMPLDEVGQRDSAIRMYQAGLWDPETALEHTGENQPERILDRVWAYQYMEKSDVNMKLGEKSAIKAGLIEKPKPTIYGPTGDVIGGGPEGLGGPGIPAVGGIEPSIPGQNMPLIPPQSNMPYVPRSPGVPGQPPLQVP